MTICRLHTRVVGVVTAQSVPPQAVRARLCASLAGASHCALLAVSAICAQLLCTQILLCGQRTVPHLCCMFTVAVRRVCCCDTCRLRCQRQLRGRPRRNPRRTARCGPIYHLPSCPPSSRALSNSTKRSACRALNKAWPFYFSIAHQILTGMRGCVCCAQARASRRMVGAVSGAGGEWRSMSPASPARSQLSGIDLLVLTLAAVHQEPSRLERPCTLLLRVVV